MNSQPPTKGSLEELFRQHLLESEAAAVPPRPLVWEQLDNSLLLAQNEKYRRRLLVHRWAVAASLLLAMLAGGGWWHSQQGAPADLATANPRGRTIPTPLAGAGMASSRQAVAIQDQAASYPALAQPNASTASTAIMTSANGSLAASSAAANSGLGNSRTGIDGLKAAYDQSGHTRTVATSVVVATDYGQGWASGVAVTRTYTTLGSAPETGLALQRASEAGGTSTATMATTASSAAFISPIAAQPIARTATSPTVSSPELSAADAASAARKVNEALLASRAVALKAAATALPATLAAVEVPERPTAKLQRWQLGAEYAATAFQPNVDFGYSAAAASYSLPTNSTNVAINNRSAAAEYRANLRAGLGQRISLRATRWLGGHWSLSTGLEAAQQQATSATSSDFVGAPLDAAYAVAPSTPRVLRATSYRYRSAGVPVELRYGNPVKTGLSFYGRVGAVVSALLNVRSEVAGTPEAARTYTFSSTNSPYRRVSATVRGGAGVQYRPAHRRWALNVGPTAEAGVQSLNSDPSQSFWSQQRPYSFGMEAGLELGRGLREQ